MSKTQGNPDEADGRCVSCHGWFSRDELEAHHGFNYCEECAP